MACSHNLLGTHAATFCSKVNAFTGTLGHIPSSIAHEGHATNHAPWTGVFRDRMGLHLDHFAINQPLFGTFPDSLLKAFNQALILLHRAGTYGYVIIFGEHPSIEIGGHIRAHVHFS